MNGFMTNWQDRSLNIADFHQKTAYLIFNHFRDSADICSDARHAAGHRLKEDESETFFFSRNIAANTKAKLLLVGDGPEKCVAWQLVEKYGLQDQVLLLGNQDRVEVSGPSPTSRSFAFVLAAILRKTRMTSLTRFTFLKFETWMRLNQAG
jgi:hypothetical protein